MLNIFSEFEIESQPWKKIDLISYIGRYFLLYNIYEMKLISYLHKMIGGFLISSGDSIFIKQDGLIDFHSSFWQDVTHTTRAMKQNFH